MYEFRNANPMNRFIDDCAIRAISIGMGMPYREAYNELAENGERLALMMDSVENVEDYLDAQFPRACSYSTTLEEFVSEHRYGTYIISLNDHLSCCVEGIIMDTFDPSDREIKCYWRIR